MNVVPRIYKPRTIPGRYRSNFIDVCKHHAKSFTTAWSWTARDPVQVCPIFPCPWKGDRALRSSKGETRKTWMLSSHAALSIESIVKGVQPCNITWQGTWTREHRRLLLQNRPIIILNHYLCCLFSSSINSSH